MGYTDTDLSTHRHLHNHIYIIILKQDFGPISLGIMLTNMTRQPVIFVGEMLGLGRANAAMRSRELTISYTARNRIFGASVQFWRKKLILIFLHHHHHNHYHQHQHYN